MSNTLNADGTYAEFRRPYSRERAFLEGNKQRGRIETDCSNKNDIKVQ